MDRPKCHRVGQKESILNLVEVSASLIGEHKCRLMIAANPESCSTLSDKYLWNFAQIKMKDLIFLMGNDKKQKYRKS